MTKRPNLLVILGAALFLVGGAIVFLVLHNSNDGSSSANKNLVPVVVAATDLAPGESGDAALASGQVVVKQVPLSQRSSDAASSTAALTGQTIDAAVKSGAQVPLTSLRAPNLRSAAITIPKGEQAVAVTVDFTAGGAGYIAAGDHINVYTVVPPNAPDVPTTVPAADPPKGAVIASATPYTKLLLSNVSVLDVSDEVAPRVEAASTTGTNADVSGTQRATSQTLTVLLALNAQQAEQAIFATSVNQLYFTVLPKGQGASSTKGVSYGQNYPVPNVTTAQTAGTTTATGGKK